MPPECECSFNCQSASPLVRSAILHSASLLLATSSISCVKSFSGTWGYAMSFSFITVSNGRPVSFEISSGGKFIESAVFAVSNLLL